MSASCRSWSTILLGLALLVTASLSGYAKSAESSHKKLVQQLQKVPSGTFVQTKYLHDMPFPLESRGRFTYSDVDGLHWLIESPIQSRLHISQQGISQAENGREVMRLDPAEHPAVALISEIFFALFAGDWSKLDEHFELSEWVSEKPEIPRATGEWSFTLTPKSMLIQQVIPRIDIRGQTQIQHLTMHEASGDKTQIAFSSHEQLTDH